MLTYPLAMILQVSFAWGELLPAQRSVANAMNGGMTPVMDRATLVCKRAACSARAVRNNKYAVVIVANNSSGWN